MKRKKKEEPALPGQRFKPLPSPKKQIASKFSPDNFHGLCDELCAGDKDLKSILSLYDYPPLWTRPNNFETFVHVILEQQVSLASALAALKQLQHKTKGITAARILLLTDEEMRNCYVSRQKMGYLRELAMALQEKKINLVQLETLPDDEVRSALLPLKGIGHWTIDIYLMFVLHRTDIFPLGDLAAVNALKRLKNLPKETGREELELITTRWKPYRTIACYLLWHYYLSAPKTKPS